MTSTALALWKPDGTPLTPAELVGDARVVTLVGAGGKTSLLHTLSGALAASGRRVLATTTTKMGMVDDPATDLDTARARLRTRGWALAGTPLGPQKFGPPTDELLAALRASTEVWIIEGDGSRRHPLKLPALSEPVVPDETDLLVIVAGMNAVGRPLGEVCHRAELAPDLAPDAPVTPSDAAQLIRRGYLDNPRLDAWPRRVVVLTHADDHPDQASAVAALLDAPRIVLAGRSSSVHKEERNEA